MMNRKNQHIQYALQFHQTQNPDWDSVALPITSFPEISYDEISLKTKIMGFSLDYPFYINAMTGGSMRAYSLNQQLAVLARECGLMLAMGSYSIALKKPEAKESFDIIRKEAPDIILGVNLGADKSAEDAKRAVCESGADFLQIHVNPLQELLMPEGERDFRGWLSNIKKMKDSVSVPVMVKQVGFGMSSADIEKLIQIGVKTIDISGMGGTNFAQIENARRQVPFPALNGLGSTTVASLREALPYGDKVEMIASGGIKEPIHIAKALNLGAKAVGIAGQILYLLENVGLEKTIDTINQWKEELKSLYLICGKKDTESFKKSS